MTDRPSINRAPEAKPFFLPAGPVGVLIVHGLGGSVAEYRPFAQQLQKQGLTASGMMVAGHGATPAELAASRPTDWVASVEQAYRDIQRRCDQVVILGVSYGAVLALAVASTSPGVSGLFLINPALAYRGGGVWQNVLLKGLRLFRSTIPKTDLTAEDRFRYRQTGSLTAWPISSILASKAFLNQARPKFSKIQCPVLVGFSRQDRYVDPAAAQAAIASLPHTETITIPSGTHRPFREPETVSWLVDQVTRFSARLKK